MMDIDIDHLRTWVGRERVQRDPLPLFPAQALAGVLNRELLPEGGEALPPAWQWLYFHEPVRQRDLGADGHPRTGDFLPPVPLPRRMWASGEFTIERPLRLGEPAERLARVAAVELKRGGSGALVFVTVEQHIRQAGQECLFERQHLVYRDMPTRPATLPTGDTAVALAQFRVPLTADAVLLMRYSALTYNAHRIHYDRDYATWQEHYPALVVHGPLLATLLAEQAALQAPGQRVERFRFRALRPAFDNDQLQLCGRRDGDELTLWVENQDGFMTMTATATLGESA